MIFKKSTKAVAGIFQSAVSKITDTESSNLSEDAQADLDPLLKQVVTKRGPADESVPWALKVAAAWSWRMLVVSGAAILIGFLIQKLAVVVIPLLVAMLLAVLLEPVLRFLHCFLRLPRTLAAVLTLLFGLGMVTAMLSLATSQIVYGMNDVVERAREGINQGIIWLSEGPFNLDTTTAGALLEQIEAKVTTYAQANLSFLASNAFSTVSSLAGMMAGLLTSLFCLFFFLKDGRKIWQWFLRLCPTQSRNSINEAAIRGWVTLGSYARAQTLVAAIDAVGIGGGAYLIGVPLALPLGVLVFLASFVPIVGAIVSGFIAVMVALVDQGFTTALLMLIIILLVQQIESNLLQPVLMSNAVNLHPMAVFLTVAAGGYTAGIAGAIFAVPAIAFLNTVILYFKGYDKFLYLNYDYSRPGGAPGTLEEEIAESFRPSSSALKEAREAKEYAEQKGFMQKVVASAERAENIKNEVAETLAEFGNLDTETPDSLEAKELDLPIESETEKPAKEE